MVEDKIQTCCLVQMLQKQQRQKKQQVSLRKRYPRSQLCYLHSLSKQTTRKMEIWCKIAPPLQATSSEAMGLPVGCKSMMLFQSRNKNLQQQVEWPLLDWTFAHS